MPLAEDFYAAARGGDCCGMTSCCGLTSSAAAGAERRVWLPRTALQPTNGGDDRHGPETGIGGNKLQIGSVVTVKPLEEMTAAFDNYASFVGPEDQEVMVPRRDPAWGSMHGKVTALDSQGVIDGGYTYADGVVEVCLQGTSQTQGAAAGLPNLLKQVKACEQRFGAELFDTDSVVLKQLEPATWEVLKLRLEEAGLVVDVLDERKTTDGGRSYNANCLCIGATARRCLKEAARIRFPMLVNESRWEEAQMNEAQMKDDSIVDSATSPMRLRRAAMEAQPEIEDGLDNPALKQEQAAEAAKCYNVDTGSPEMYAEVKEEDMTEERFSRQMMAPFIMSCAECFRQNYPAVIELRQQLLDEQDGQADCTWSAMDGAKRLQEQCFSSGERQKLVMSIMKEAGVDVALFEQGVVRIPVPMGNQETAVPESLYANTTQIRDISKLAEKFVSDREDNLWQERCHACKDGANRANCKDCAQMKQTNTRAVTEELIWVMKKQLHQVKAMKVVPLHNKLELDQLRAEWAVWHCFPSEWLKPRTHTTPQPSH